MGLLNKVSKFIERHRLFHENERVLTGVSGGADSVVLLDILLRLGYDCVAAHCNFHLRGRESDRDEAFVRKFVSEREVPLLLEHFDTFAFAEKQKISIEMAARDLRYAWFHQIAAQEHAGVIAVAHHGDDSAETLLINLIRGTGLKGLSGIDPKNGMIVRPLLDCSRREIEEYARQRNLSYVTDSTNLTDEYTRNKIRNEILPLMSEINPSILETLRENSKLFRGAYMIYREKVAEAEKELVRSEESRILIDINKLLLQADPQSIIFEILNPYHFNAANIREITEALTENPGLQFYSPTHRLTKDREVLIVEPINRDATHVEYLISEETVEIKEPLHLQLKRFPVPENFAPTRLAHKIHLDADKVKFPLTIRGWQQGDRFYPLGMRGSKKLSDYFTDIKLSLPEKEQVKLLISDNLIVWVIGMRLDDRFKVDKKSRNILEISVI